MKKIIFSTVLVSLLSVSSYADFNFQEDASLGADIGTTGVGVTYVKKLKGYDNKWGLRVGYHQFSKSYDTTNDNTKYDFDLDLQDIQIMADYHPWNTSFKVTFGLMYNGNELNGKIVPSATTIVIDGVSYSTSDIGSVDTSVDFDQTVAPYIGIGWDTSFYQPSKKWGFTFNLGLAYTGSAKVDYTPHYNAGINPVTKANIETSLSNAKVELQDDLDDYKYLPFVSIGFNYKF